jgi:hypothetical protein
MAIDASTIRKWATGATTKSRNVDAKGDDDEMPPDEGAEGEDEEGGDAPRNALWAGEMEADAEIDEESAAELVGWMEENEPEIADALLELAENLTAEEPDPRMLGHAREELKTVNQYLSPEYPELTPEQRSAIDKNLSIEMKAAGMPERGEPAWDMAVAKAIVSARSEKKADEEEEEDEEGAEKKKPNPFAEKKPNPFAKKGPPASAGEKKPNPFAKGA